MVRVALTEQDFTDLVNGKVVKKDGAEIALQDIGFSRIIQIAENAIRKSWESKS